MKRRVIHKNEDVSNIAGRERYHFLIAQLKEESSYQKHVKQLSQELQRQKENWENREKIEQERLEKEAEDKKR